MTYKEMWREVPKPLQIMVYTILGVIAAVGFGLLFGWIIVWLWNWLMPMIFGLPTITFWQGLGLLALVKIFFGVGSHWGSDSSSSSKKKKKHMHGDWNQGSWKNWEHYNEWWESEGKEAFRKYADQATDETNAESETDTEAKQEPDAEPEPETPNPEA